MIRQTKSKSPVRKSRKKNLSTDDIDLSSITIPDHVPEQRYYSVGAVAKCVGIQPYVLRYWEKEFEQLNPQKRNGERRYYTPQDLLLVFKIRYLLHIAGFTVEGAKFRLKNEMQKSRIEKPSEVAALLAHEILSDLCELHQQMCQYLACP